MKIGLRKSYKSIATLTTDEIPDFAVLIGRNGAGKTQLLDALSGGATTIPDIRVDEIEKYDMVSFHPPNSSRAIRHANQFAQDTADSYLLSPHGVQPPIETTAVIFEQFAREIERESGVQARDDFERDLRNEIQRLEHFSVFAADDQSSPYKKSLNELVLAPLNRANTTRQRRTSSVQFNNSFNDNPAALLSGAMKLTGKLPHELTRGDIMRASHSEGDTMSNSISEVFADYKVDQFIWAHKRIEKEHVRYDQLMAEYRTKNPPPWETLRAILSDMRDATGADGLFNFDFSDPGDFDLRVENYEQFSFTAVMTNRTTGAQYDLDSLSSGEKILMALCLVSFNQYLGRRRPKLLLLDELDAVLHPSMVTALVALLKDLFVSQGTKVLMASHSPMTVAALDEADVFRVARTGDRVKVSRATKSEAINELSEGLATVDVGLKIAAYDEAKVTILTEGHNAKHLKKWVEVMGLSDDVHVFEELGEQTSAGELRMYGRLLGRMNTNTHFVIVWDCDAAKEAQILRQDLPSAAKVIPFAFKRRQENSVARNGIENNYGKEILEPFSITKSRTDDGKILGREFHKDRKTDFANHVQQYGTLQYFEHFEDFHGIVSGILESY